VNSATMKILFLSIKKKSLKSTRLITWLKLQPKSKIRKWEAIRTSLWFSALISQVLCASLKLLKESTT